MIPWIALSVMSGFGVVIWIVSFVGYRDYVRWCEDFDRRNPGVAEKLGIKSRVSNTERKPDALDS